MKKVQIYSSYWKIQVFFLKFVSCIRLCRFFFSIFLVADSFRKCRNRWSYFRAKISVGRLAHQKRKRSRRVTLDKIEHARRRVHDVCRVLFIYVSVFILCVCVFARIVVEWKDRGLGVDFEGLLGGCRGVPLRAPAILTKNPGVFPCKILRRSSSHFGYLRFRSSQRRKLLFDHHLFSVFHKNDYPVVDFYYSLVAQLMKS